ncbi:hypothetical protein KL86DYS1_30579 [uncultured Dysgonomonas sp.]|uniref:Uncharacterized protein n=1 Tax=uncultured Dysgonomonas sp. TaxID=206096 RepID=A0A212JVH6_9BACT|nr:hypothetical protein KL86DYS1_30579 [uncultured Dysgonomonas sp.]
MHSYNQIRNIFSGLIKPFKKDKIKFTLSIFVSLTNTQNRINHKLS